MFANLCSSAMLVFNGFYGLDFESLKLVYPQETWARYETKNIQTDNFLDISKVVSISGANFKCNLDDDTTLSVEWKVCLPYDILQKKSKKTKRKYLDSLPLEYVDSIAVFGVMRPFAQVPFGKDVHYTCRLASKKDFRTDFDHAIDLGTGHTAHVYHLQKVYVINSKTMCIRLYTHYVEPVIFYKIK